MVEQENRYESSATLKVQTCDDRTRICGTDESPSGDIKYCENDLQLRLREGEIATISCIPVASSASLLTMDALDATHQNPPYK